MGFLVPRRRASCRMPVRAAGTDIRCSREVIPVLGFERGYWCTMGESDVSDVVVATEIYGLKETLCGDGGGFKFWL